MQEKITIADAPDCLNTNDKAMWILGYQAAVEARKPCLLQLQEPPTKTEALAHYSQQAILAMGEAAHVAVAVPDGAMGLLEALESMVDVCEGHDFDGAPSDAHMEKARAAISAYRAALAATPAAAKEIREAESEVWPCVNIDVDDAGNVTNAKLYSPGLPAGNHDVYPVRVPYMDEHTEAWKACHSELWKLVPDFMRNSQLNGIDGAVAAIRHLATIPAAAAPVGLPEPDAAIKEVLGLVDLFATQYMNVSYLMDQPESETDQHDMQRAYDMKASTRQYIESKLRALLAGVSAPAAQPERKYICPVRTIADLVNNLMLMDQAMPIYGAQYIEHPAGQRRAIAVPPTVSIERVKDSRWIGEGEALNTAIIWTRAEQPAAPQAQADARDADLLNCLDSHSEGVIRLDAVPNYLHWGPHWEHKTARAAIAAKAAQGEQL